MNIRLRFRIRRLRKRRAQIHRQIEAERYAWIDMCDAVSEAVLEFNDEMAMFYRFEQHKHRNAMRELAKAASEIRHEVLTLCREL